MDPDRLIAIVHAAYASGVIKGPQLVLLLLANHRREGWRLGDLADATGLSPSLINAVKKDLVKKGKAFVHQPARDARVGRIYLSDAGRTEGISMWKALTDLADAGPALRSASPPISNSAKPPTPS